MPRNSVHCEREAEDTSHRNILVSSQKIECHQTVGSEILKEHQLISEVIQGFIHRYCHINLYEYTDDLQQISTCHVLHPATKLISIWSKKVQLTNQWKPIELQFPHSGMLMTQVMWVPMERMEKSRNSSPVLPKSQQQHIDRTTEGSGSLLPRKDKLRSLGNRLGCECVRRLS